MAAVVEFDFATRTERVIGPAEAAGACAAGKFCWVDVDLDAEGAAAGELLAGLGVPAGVIGRMPGAGEDGRCDVDDACLHATVSAVRLAGDGIAFSRVDLLVGASYLVTVRRGEVEFLDEVRRTYRRDFAEFAKSPGFLLYDCWDRLAKGYEASHRRLDDRVRRVRDEIFGEVDDEIFARVAGMTHDLLDFRRAVLAARSVLEGLAGRRTAFVPDTTRPYLERIAVNLDRLAGDLAVERESLAETLTLYLGLVSHRTNRVLNRLTVVSLVFLPLSFLCGVYGMNFEVMPELKWGWGYPAFWVAAAAVAGAALLYLKRLRLW